MFIIAQFRGNSKQSLVDVSSWNPELQTVQFPKVSAAVQFAGSWAHWPFELK